MGTLNEEKLTGYLDSLVEKGIPSVDCIVYKDHKEIYRHMNGTVDIDKKQPVQPNQRYLMFSMTKVQTMTAFMQLVEDGKVSLEDEVGKYIPSYKKLFVNDELGLRELTEPMKIWHLLSMQSGLDYDMTRPGLLRVLKEKGENATTKDIVDSFIESPLEFVPGTHFYPNGGHENTLRLNFSNSSEEQIRQGMTILRSLIADACR